MLVRLMYASRAVSSVNQEALHAILRQCKAKNPSAGITGVLRQHVPRRGVLWRRRPPLAGTSCG